MLITLAPPQQQATSYRHPQYDARFQKHSVTRDDLVPRCFLMHNKVTKPQGSDEKGNWATTPNVKM